MMKKVTYFIGIGLFLLVLASCSKSAAPQYTTVNDYDGNIYKIFKIGNQYWMLGNLKSTHYADGTPLKNNTKFIYGDTAKSYYIYNNDTAYLNDYGYLYNWEAIMNGAPGTTASPSGVQGLCPNGFHIPSDAEWQTLITYLGGDSVAGGLMKGDAYWGGGNVGYSFTNASSFSALPAGASIPSGLYVSRQVYGYLWSATQHDSATSDIIILNDASAAVADTFTTKASGLSCRCIKN